MKKTVLISTLLISIFSIVLIYNKQNLKKDVVISKEEDNIGLPMALMVETNMDTDVYEAWSGDDWPGVGYTFNEEKSGCENGGTLEYNPETQSVIMKTNISDKCYAYFDSPLKIFTIEDLVEFSDSVNNGKTYANEYVLLMNDLDFNSASSYQNNVINQNLISGAGFTPIGNRVTPFSGTFEGNNKRIDNLFINTDYTAELALFGYVKNGYIKKLTVGGTVSSQVASVLGGIVARFENSTIENCINEVNVTSLFNNHAVGGLIGWIDTNNISSTIIECQNKGTIKGGNYLGGLIGGHQGGDITIENSSNNGTIENTVGDNIGGLIGFIYSKANNVKLENSLNNGKIIDNNFNDTVQRVGGIIGGNITASLDIINTHNYGNITISRTDFDDFIQISVGGIIGSNQTNDNLIAKINNSSNQGTITGGTWIGGLVGLNSASNLIINESFNQGSIDNSTINFNVDTNSRNWTETGGIIGFNDQSNEYILNSYNIGKINGNDTAGGIISLSHYNSKDTIINSYNQGNIISNNDCSSIGFFNKAANSDYNILNINNIFNLGNINSPRMHTALSIDINITYDIKNAYSKEDIPTANIPSLMIYYDNDYLNSQIFVDTLNTNLSSINLQDIDPLLEDYTLAKWVKGPNGYPIFDYQQ